MNGITKNLLVGMVFFVAALMAIVGFFYASNFTGGVAVSQEKWGQFGDYFGGVLNPILSFFAFSALLYTVYLQMRARAEAETQHDEQVFDGRLFKLLSTNLEMASALCIKPGTFDLTFDGLRALEFSWTIFKSQFLEHINREDNPEKQFSSIRVNLKSFKRLHGSVVSVYFDSVFFILEFIRLSGQSEQRRAFALHALRSQMTSCGRGLLFYYLICSEEYFLHAQTIMDFSFLDDLTDDPLCEVRHQLLSAAEDFHKS